MRAGPLVVIALLIASIMLAGTTSANLIFVQGGYFNDDMTPTVRNQDFRSGLSYWTIEAGSAVRSSTYYRTNPTYPYSLRLSGPSTVIVRQDLTQAALNQLKNNYATFSFWFRSYNDAARAQLVIYDRYYETICRCYIGGWNYYESPWIRASVESGNLAWTNVIARGYVSSMATQGYVRILVDDFSSYRYISSYVDDATVSLYDTAIGSSGYGNAALTFALWKADDYPTNTLYRAAYLSFAMSGQALGNYRIISVQIRVELEPQYDDCWWIFCTRKTSQDGRLWIEGIAQANNLNIAVNPQDQQQERETGLAMASIGIGIVAGVATANPAIGAGTALAIGAAADLGTTFLFDWIGETSTSFDTTAYGGADYSTQVRWNHRSSNSCLNPGAPFVTKASGANDAVWIYKPGVSGYRLKIVAGIEWGEPQVLSGRCAVVQLRYVATTTLVGYVYA